MALSTFLYGSSRETPQVEALVERARLGRCAPSVRTTDGGKTTAASMSYVARTRSRTTEELTR